MEGNVYICSWKKKGRKYIICYVHDETISGLGSTIEEAEEGILENICLRFGDGEAVLEYDKPLPKTDFEKKYGKPGIVSISGNDGFSNLLNSEMLPDRPVCPLCKRKRFVPMPVTPEYEKLCSSDGVTMGDLGPVFSDHFFSLFAKNELEKLNLRKIKGLKRYKRDFFEVLGKPDLHCVGFKEFPGLLNNKCKHCGIGCSTYLYQNEMYNFVAADDLPKPLPSIFLIGDEHDEIHVCLPLDKYYELQKKAGMKNICSRRIWIAPKEKVVRNNNEHYLESLYFKLKPFNHCRPVKILKKYINIL